MNCHFKKSEICNGRTTAGRGFSLIEAMTALIILAMVCSSVLVVINRGMASVAEGELRMQAFEVARENMERILAADSVSETVSYGSSTRYPNIRWENNIEAFKDSSSEQNWVRAVCSAEYTDDNGQPQSVELVHLLTYLTEEQAAALEEQRAKQQQLQAQQQQDQKDASSDQDEPGPDQEVEQPEVEEGPPAAPRKPDNMTDEQWEALLKALGL